MKAYENALTLEYRGKLWQSAKGKLSALSMLKQLSSESYTSKLNKELESIEKTSNFLVEYTKKSTKSPLVRFFILHMITYACKKLKQYEKDKPWIKFDIPGIDPDIKIDMFLEFGRSRLNRIKMLLDLSIAAVSDAATAGILGVGANFTQHVIELTPKLLLMSVTLFWENMGGYMKQQSRTNPNMLEKYYNYIPGLLKNVRLTKRNIRELMIDHGKNKLEYDNSEIDNSFTDMTDTESSSSDIIQQL